jgi:5-hydroxyisourate hydrolase
MNRISTHVLDTSAGKPAQGIVARLLKGETELSRSVTDADGRCPNLLPAGMTLEASVYTLIFQVGDYFPHGFYPQVSISFKASAGTSHYHVPLLLSPFGYTTYRGS